MLVMLLCFMSLFSAILTVLILNSNILQVENLLRNPHKTMTQVFHSISFFLLPWENLQRRRKKMYFIVTIFSTLIFNVLRILMLEFP